jgi:AcrR family transcriptional regulator
VARGDDRRVADALGYASPLIYEHFRDKDDALTAVVHEGFAALADAMREAAARPVDPADPDAYARAVARAYFDFARHEPAVYQLMHGMGGVALDPTNTLRGAQAVCDVGITALERWAAAAGVRLPDALAATEILWCALHGVASLALAARLDAHVATGDTHAGALLDGAVGALLGGWRATHGAVS